MDVYITEKETGTRIALSMLPEKTKRKSSTKFMGYDIINLGEVKLPRGTKLLAFSWSGTFPGASRKTASFVKAHHWREPKELESIFDRWRIKGTKLTLMVTETFINHEVMLAEFNPTNKGGNGDIDYDVTFIQSRDIQIHTVTEIKAEPVPLAASSTTPRPAPAEAAAKTYTVVSGDCLWNIAQKYLGSGARYTEIYELNKSVIGSSPNRIYPGQVFTLPA